MKRMVWGTVLSVCVVACTFGADAVQAQWIGPGGGPDVVRVEPLKQKSIEQCSGVSTHRQVDGLGLVTVCLYAGTPDFGMVLSGGTRRLVRGHAFDDRLYLVKGVCELRLSCVYRSERDILVEKIQVGLVQHMRIHLDVLESMALSWNTAGGHLQYEFTPKDSSWVVAPPEGSPLPIYSYAVSKSGRWVIAEVRNLGTVRINSVSREILRITDRAYRYGLGMDPTQHLAISEAGDAAIVTGRNSGYSLYDIDASCGQQITRPITVRFSAGYHSCRYTDSSINTYQENFHYAHHPRFLADDSHVSVELQARTGDTSLIVFRKPQYMAGKDVSYVAFGDSFSSGEGEDNDSWYLSVTPSDTSCHRSTRSYPFRLHALLEHDGFVMNVACSGARLHDIWPSEEYAGQGGRLNDINPADITSVRQHSLAEGGGGVLPQRDFASLYQPDEITLSVGGNDVGIVAKLKACASLGSCHWVEPVWRQRIAQEIDDFTTRLADRLLLLKEAAPISNIRVVGYPDPILPEGSCDTLTKTLFSLEERQLLRHSVMRLNRALFNAARSSGVDFIDVFDATTGHQLCADGRPAMNGFRFGDDAGPIDSMPWLRFIGAESFHPTYYGHQRVAEKIATAEPALQAPGIDTVYWSDHAESDVGGRLIFSPEIFSVSELSVLSIKIPQETVKPGSPIRVQLFSEPIELFEGIAREGYPVELTISLDDKDIPPGHHTVIAHSTSVNDEQLFLYTEVYVPPKILQKADTHVVANESQPVLEEQPTERIAALGVQPAASINSTTSKSASSAVLAVSDSEAIALNPSSGWRYIVVFALVSIITICLLYALLLKK